MHCRVAEADVCIRTTSLLAVLSRTKAGDKYLAIDIILCALFGGFTVLSTKAFSSFLTLMFLNT